MIVRATELIDEEDARRRAFRSAAEVISIALRPPPALSVSQWADRYRVLPSTAAESGHWRTDRTPYLREFMDVCGGLEYEHVVFMKPAQIGGSEALNNVLGYFIHQDPAPILFVQISDGEAAKYSKERIAPMIADCPELAALVKPARTRDSGNTIESKHFAGGHLGIVGANAPAKLRSRPRRVVLMDEIDGYPASAGSEGDPRALAKKRTTTFWNRKIIEISTPTVRGLSRIEDEYERSDRRKYVVPCPDCRELQVLRFPGLKWDDRDGPVFYVCEHCGGLIPERKKVWMLDPENGAHWRSEDPDARTAGFWINALYSPWLQWRDLRDEFLESKDNPENLQVFVNTRLAESWEESGHTISDDDLYDRREDYPSNPLPDEVVLLTAGVDVQPDRLELEVLGWGIGEQTWSIDYFVIAGDPSTRKIWDELDQILLSATWSHPLGPRLPISASAVDSGWLTQEVYKYCRPRHGNRIWAVKGVDGMGRPIIGRPSLRTKGKVPMYPVGVDTAKTALSRRLQIAKPGPGYCHFPRRDPYDNEYFRQLTSEKLVRRAGPGGRPIQRWVRRPNRRAETLDCRVYAMAAFEGLVLAGWRLESIAKQLRGEEVSPRRRRRIISKGVDV